jgi:RNA polymerase sigma-70 factor (ECF subfamily)
MNEMEYLIRGIREGDRKSFKRAYDTYHEKLYFFVLKYNGSTYIAEEVVQLTFIKLWENREKLSDSFSLSAQIFRIGKSLLIDLMRREKRRGLLLTQSEGLTPFVQDGEQVIIDREALSRLNEKIEHLPPVRKKIFTLSRIDGLSYQDIAQKLSLSIKTVENHIILALKQLRNFLLLIPLILLLA